MADSKTVHIKENKEFLKEVPTSSKEDEKYDIKIEKNDQDAIFSELKDGSTSSEIDIKVKKHGDKDSDWKNAKAKVKCKSGFFRTRFYLDSKIKVGTDTIELKAEKLENNRLSTDKHSYGWGFYGIFVVLAIIVIGGIWWWIASSKSEDEDKGDI